jgi:WD40 repeat protein
MTIENSGKIYCLEYLSNHLLACGCENNRITIWNLKYRTFKFEKILEGHASVVRALQLLRENFLASCSADKTIKLWNLKSFCCVRTIEAHHDSITHLKLLNDGLLASCSYDKTIKFWDLKTYECIMTWEDTKEIDFVELLNEELLASCSIHKKYIKIRNLNSSKCIKKIKKQGTVWCLANDQVNPLKFDQITQHIQSCNLI